MVIFDLPWAAEILAAAALVLGTAAELLHLRRLRRVAALAFGPARRPRPWARLAPLPRVLGAVALSWGLVTLLVVEPRKHSTDGSRMVDARTLRHVVLILDVSPSMHLEDAGPHNTQSRAVRAREVLDSFFRRIPVELYRISVVAVYNGAKPVVEDTDDLEVVQNILGDLPMQYAFASGPTRLFAGLEEAARIARPWNPGSTTLVLVSDGDTVPAQGMPAMPASVAHVLVVGVGDPLAGKFIDGRQSRQDVSTLRQIAARLHGTYHNGNEKHLTSVLLAELAHAASSGLWERLTRREYALIATAAGAALLAFLLLLLAAWGTAWRPGVPGAGAGASAPSRLPWARAS